jgi:CelD/BcsL family acetyltransferase involved in cellulose biosynthesis
MSAAPTAPCRWSSSASTATTRHAATQADIDRILTFFRAQKAARFAAHAIHNVFAEPGVMEFIADVCRDGLAQGRPVIELHALEGGGDVLAVIGGVSDGTRFSVCSIPSRRAPIHGRARASS